VRLPALNQLKVEGCPHCPTNSRRAVSPAFSIGSATARKRRGGFGEGVLPGRLSRSPSGQRFPRAAATRTRPVVCLIEPRRAPRCVIPWLLRQSLKLVGVPLGHLPVVGASIFQTASPLTVTYPTEQTPPTPPRSVLPAMDQERPERCHTCQCVPLVLFRYSQGFLVRVRAGCLCGSKIVYPRPEQELNLLRSAPLANLTRMNIGHERHDGQRR
jgi:hypothetical protein